MDHYNSCGYETHEVVVDCYHAYIELHHKPNCPRCALEREADTSRSTMSVANVSLQDVIDWISYTDTNVR
jgi:hypothetical protein